MRLVLTMGVVMNDLPRCRGKCCSYLSISHLISLHSSRIATFKISAVLNKRYCIQNFIKEQFGGS